MSRPTIEPVSDATLPAMAQFLHLHLRSERSAADWEAAFRVRWNTGDAPNHGFVLRDKDGAVVGAIGAYYARREIAGRTEQTCNITSWCVLDAYRQQSTRLAMTLLGQPGFHFTNFSPTQVVGATLKFLKFQELDERVAVILNLPWPPAAGLQVVTDPARIEAALSGAALQAYRDHAPFPWLRHLLLGREGHWCHVIYKRRRFKGLPAAQILHVGDRELFAAGWRRLSLHLLLRGMVSTHVEVRQLDRLPGPHRLRVGFNRKLFMSTSLSARDIDYLYSESVAMDL